jgi:hypothetical protein
MHGSFVPKHRQHTSVTGVEDTSVMYVVQHNGVWKCFGGVLLVMTMKVYRIRKQFGKDTMNLTGQHLLISYNKCTTKNAF